MKSPLSWTTRAGAILAVVAALGTPVGLLATYPAEREAGFAGAIGLAILLVALPVSVWTIVLVWGLVRRQPAARWLTMFTYYMVAGATVRQLLAGGPRDTDFLQFLILLLGVSVGILVSLSMPPSARDSTRDSQHVN